MITDLKKLQKMKNEASLSLQNTKVGHQHYGRINWIKCRTWSYKKTKKILVKIEGFKVHHRQYSAG